jgi:GGDEF domain-containing protein
VDPGTPRRRRARPVADAPVGELLARTDQLAKGWLLALLERVALEDAAAVLASGLAADGPRICAAALRAIADDRDLRRLEPGGVLESLVSGAGAFGGESSPAAALRAVEALHGVLWSALRSEMRDPDPDLVYDVAARLDAVCELIRGAAVARQAAPEARVAPAQAAAADLPPEPPVSAPEPDPLAEPDPTRPSLRAVYPTPSPAAREDALWVAALDEEITRSRRGGSPLSLLLVELEDGERIAESDLGGDAAAAFGRFAQAVRGVLRRQDLLASEAQTRVWVIARDTARPGARALADRIAGAVAGLEPHRGARLGVSVGLAVLGEDAHDCPGLLEAAEEAALTAAAGGERVAEYVRGDRPDGAQ